MCPDSLSPGWQRVRLGDSLSQGDNVSGQSVAGQCVRLGATVCRREFFLGITARAALAREHPPTREASQRRGGAPDEQRSPEEKGVLQI